MNGRAREGTWNGVAAILAEDRSKLLLAVLGFWILVGVITSLQDVAATRLTTGASSFFRRTGDGLVAGILWVPLTFLIVALHARFSLEGPRRALALAVHAVGCVAVPLVYNLLWCFLRDPGAPPAMIMGDALRGWLLHLHIAAAVYWAILGADRWRRRAADRVADRSSALQSITVRTGQRVDVVEVGTIAWIEGAGDYVRLHADHGSFLSSGTLSRLADRLDPRHFLRVHRSVIVNLDRVRRYRPLGHGDYLVTLDDGSAVRVSRTRGREFRRRLESGDPSEHLP